MTEETAGCPVMHNPADRGQNATMRWWPNQLDLRMLHQHAPASNPLGDDFDYSEAFLALDYNALKADLTALMTDSKAVSYTHLTLPPTPYV